MVEFFVGRGFIIEFSQKIAQLLFNEIILSLTETFNKKSTQQRNLK